MKQPKSIQISIPNPCQENWNKMTHQEQGRFCSRCQKCVLDFTGYTDEQLYNYLLAHKNERICGRVLTTQTNRAIQLPAQPHSSLYKWVIAAGLVLLFTAAPEGRTFAQAPLTDQASPNVPVPQDKDNNNDTTGKIEGVVIDEFKEPIIEAVIKVIKNDTVISSAITDIDGKFSITGIKQGSYTVIVNYIGYHEEQLLFNTTNTSTLQINLSSAVTLGGFETIILDNNPPLINQSEGGGTKTITSDELEKGAY